MAIDTKLVIGGEDRSKKALQSARGGIVGLSGAAKKAAGAFALLAGAAGIGAVVSRVVDLGSSLLDLRDRLGVNVKAMSELRAVAKLTGVSFGTLTTSLQRQSRRIAEATKGTGEAVKALKELNISAESLITLRADQQFEVLAAAIGKIQNPSLQAAIAMKLWDTEGVALLQTINEFGGDITKARESVSAFGVTMTELEAKQLKAADQAFIKFKLQLEGLQQSIVLKLAPGLEFIGRLLSGVITSFLQLGDVVGGVGSVLVTIYSGVANAVIRAIESLKGFAGAIALVVTGNFSKAFDAAKASLDKLTSIADIGSDTVKTVFAIGKEAAVDFGKVASEAIDKVIESWHKMGEQAPKAIEKVDRAAERAKFKISGLPEPVSAADQAFKKMSDSASQLKGSLQSVADGTIDMLSGQIANLTGELADVRTASQRIRDEAQNKGAFNLAAPEQGRPSIFGIGEFRTLYGADGQAIRRLQRGETAAQALASLGQFATGGTAPADGSYRLEAGERVISNNTTVNINFPGVPTNPGQFRDWVRSTLVPELSVAFSR